MKNQTIKLPLNCNVAYTPNFLSKEESKLLYQKLIGEYEIQNQRLEYHINGKMVKVDNGKVMFMDEHLYQENKLPEVQWGKTAIWFPELKKIKERVESFIGKEFNVCVCIHYPDGSAGVAYHSDLVAYGDTTFIGSISLGEERVFCLREKEKTEEFKLLLEEGSLLLMGEHCQERYEHSLPVNPQYKNGRINLTFRKYGF